MKTGTLLLLLVLVAGLGALWLARAKETIQGGPQLGEYPLLPELSAERVRLLRIDHLERGFQLRFERDAAGRWYMTDPVSYPAQGALLRTLLTSLEAARGEPAPEVAPAQVGLDPPQVVLECVQVGEGGERTLRVELGGLDLDSSRVYARVPGHPSAAAGGPEVFRTTRMLSNTLERIPDDYRERRATSLLPQEVLSIRRRGRVYMGEQQAWVDLFFDALSGPDGWKRVTQPTVSLDPTAMGLLARGATALTIERFVDDSPKDLSRYGLDPPLFTLELQGLEGDPVVLAFGHPPSAQDHPIGEYDWFCQRQGYAHVWEVGIRDVELLTQPASLFFDQIVVRTLREDVQRLELAGGGTRRTVQRTKKGWEVWEGAADGSESVHQPGNTAAIEETLAALERLQLAEHFEGEAFEPTAPPASFTLVLQNGARLGGALGRPTRDPRSGAQGLQFLRAGDEVVALIDESALALCTRPLAELRSRKMHQLQEAAVRAIVLTQRAQGRTYTFVNNGDNLWNPEGETIRAPAGFVQSLDGLLNLGAERWLESAPAAEALLDVRVERVEGTPLAFTFLKTGEGAYVCTSEAGQAAEVGGELVERLLALF